MSRLLLLPLALLVVVPLGCAPQVEVAEAEKAPAAERPAPAPALLPPEKLIATTAEKVEELEDKNLGHEDIGLDPNIQAALPEIERLDQNAVDAAVTNDPVGQPLVGGTEPVTQPNPFPGRTGATKSKLLKENGGNAESERGVALGLAWLARQQKQDGGWEFDQGEKEDRAGATGLALFPFLAAGETHKRKVEDIGKYREPVSRALDFLTKSCPPSGPNAGKFEGAAATGQALATIALCEAYGLTKDAALKPHAQAAINHIQKTQAADGGWADKADGTSDLTVAGWQIQALQSARLTKELVVDDRVIKKATAFLNRVAAGSRKSMYGATDSAGAAPGTAPTATGLLCRYYTDGWGPVHPGTIDGVAGLAKNPPSATNRDPLYVYHATQVVHFYEGEEWKNWNEGPKGADGTRKGGTRDLLTGSQFKKDGAALGSWDAEGEFGKRYGRLGTTALNVLTLEVYYRHLPLYKRGADGNAVKIIEDK